MIVLIGVLALTLDYGFVLLARRQMQTGVNAAALEGARDINGLGRENARDLMRNIYDDDLDPNQNDTTIGAGIDKSLIQGDGFQSTTIGDGDGLSNTLANRSQYIYRPNPQLNVSNERHGDFIRGDFVPNQSHNEDSTYIRNDFALNGDNGNAFLARLRRTHNPNGLDQVPGVSSSGGGLPLIIGHLAWFAATSPQAEYSIRRDGVTVRATAIAQQQVALRVGNGSDRVYGALPFAISVAELKARNFATGIVQTSATLTMVGQFVGPLHPATPSSSGYIAVYTTINGVNRVIGFKTSGASRLPNASARLTDAWEELGLLSEAERTVISNVQKDPGVRSQLLKVPVLVRSMR